MAGAELGAAQVPGGGAMSWIPLVSNEEASPEVKAMYAYIRERWGFVPNYFLALGRDVQLLRDQMNLYTDAMFDDHGGLPRLIKEQLAIVVSGLNMSSYCLPAHLEILGRLGMDKSLGRKLALSYPSAPVEPKVMELFRFADKLNYRPGEMERADVNHLREIGWSEEVIFETVLDQPCC
jgi:uncharacterized peroxidase-related enzyme